MASLTIDYMMRLYSSLENQQWNQPFLLLVRSLYHQCICFYLVKGSNTYVFSSYYFCTNILFGRVHKGNIFSPNPLSVRIKWHERSRVTVIWMHWLCPVPSKCSSSSKKVIHFTSKIVQSIFSKWLTVPSLGTCSSFKIYITAFLCSSQCINKDNKEIIDVVFISCSMME